MDFLKSFTKSLDILRKDNINGSMTIAKKGIEIFFDTIAKLEKYDYEIINFIAFGIKNTKPTMSALENAMNLCLINLKLNYTTLPLAQIKSNILAHLEEQTRDCIDTARYYLKSQHSKTITLITCSYSSTFLALAQKLNENSLIHQIYVLETFWNGVSHSQNTLKKLHKSKIKASEIAFSDLKDEIEKIDCAIIGADRVLSDSSVINGIPSLELAKAMQGYAPFYVIAEKLKTTDKLVIEDGFEIVPNYLITQIFM